MTKTNINIANGVICAFVIGAGIAFSVLVYMLFDKIVQTTLSSFGLSSGGFNGYSAYASSPIWSIGFAFIIPGLIGAIATCARCKGGYITQMVFCILTLVITGIIFIICVLALGAFAAADAGNCRSVGSTCVCGAFATTNLNFSCEDLNSINGMAIGIVVMVVVGWIMTLVATILGGMLACAREETQPGFVIQPNPGVTVQMGNMPPQQYGQQAYSPQQPYYGQQYGQKM
ncbi:uncharacterized protein [Haliotis cracherodii]|uniref:uncharacterized protein n=1 Tax=Haliotis cracherodii TaxID=6455 RepID=UPI0039E90526